MVDRMRQMAVRVSWPICSKAGSLLSQRDDCGCWPEATSIKLGVRTSLAPKRRSHRERRLRQITPFARDATRAERDRLFFAARAARIPSYLSALHSFVMLGIDPVMYSRYFWFITLFLLCHEQMHAQLLTNALPATDAGNAAVQMQVQQPSIPGVATSASPDVPDDPSQQILPVARPEPLPATGVPVHWTTGTNGYQE